MNESGIDRTQDDHVQRRLKEIQEPDYGKSWILKEYQTSPAQRVQSFERYVKAVLRDCSEPEHLNNEQLLEQLESFLMDSTRYSSWNSEHNFAIMAYAGKWFKDIRAEILKRMK